MRRFVNRLKRVARRLTNLYKPRPWWLIGGEKEEKGREEKEGNAREEACVGV
jgi:hypothetical protein